MRLIGIVAADSNWAIGKKNGLLYKLPKDMARFKKITTGHFVLCGYNTLLSFPNSKPLPNRITVCLAPESVERDDCFIVHSLDDMLALAKEIGPNADFYVIGGAMLYRTFLPYYDAVAVTKVDAEDPEAAAFFPNLDEDPDFKIRDISRDVLDNGYVTRYVTYARKGV